MLSGPSMGKAIEKEVNVDESEGSNPVESKNMDSFVDISKKEGKKKGEVVLKEMPRPPPPFP